MFARKKNKKAVLNAFRREDSCVRVLVATIAFGMGGDCKGVHRTVHFGQSKNIEAYIQETGRAGRDGKQSVAFLVYHGLLLNHVDKDMKHYVKTGECRRTTLLRNFDGTSTLSSPQPAHMCCDNCAQHMPTVNVVLQTAVTWLNFLHSMKLKMNACLQEPDKAQESKRLLCMNTCVDTTRHW